MLPSTRALLGGIVDYAGTFPPASLGLADALSEYAKARIGTDSWLLGRFVLSAAHLDDFAKLAPMHLPATGDAAWPITLILSVDAARHLQRIHPFNEAWQRKAAIASVELAPAPITQIGTLARAIPNAVEAFFEAPFDTDLDARFQAIEAVGGAAKLRTGGIGAGAVPTPEGVARFLTAADEAGIGFKATAGLHHAVRGCYALTYETASATDTMYGFLNLAVAAALIRAGAVLADVVEALVEPSADAFRFGADALTWRSRTISTTELADSRRFFRSFGSCSFREPADELRRLRLI